MEKNFALCAAKKINILTLVLSEKKILNETKNHNPPSFLFKCRHCRHCILTINWTQVFMRCGVLPRVAEPLKIFFIVQYFIHSICGDPGHK